MRRTLKKTAVPTLNLPNLKVTSSEQLTSRSERLTSRNNKKLVENLLENSSGTSTTDNCENSENYSIVYQKVFKENIMSCWRSTKN